MPGSAKCPPSHGEFGFLLWGDRISNNFASNAAKRFEKSLNVVNVQCLQRSLGVTSIKLLTSLWLF